MEHKFWESLVRHGGRRARNRRRLRLLLQESITGLVVTVKRMECLMESAAAPPY